MGCSLPITDRKIHMVNNVCARKRVSGQNCSPEDGRVHKVQELGSNPTGADIDIYCLIHTLFQDFLKFWFILSGFMLFLLFFLFSFSYPYLFTFQYLFPDLRMP